MVTVGIPDNGLSIALHYVTLYSAAIGCHGNGNEHFIPMSAICSVKSSPTASNFQVQPRPTVQTAGLRRIICAELKFSGIGTAIYLFKVHEAQMGFFCIFLYEGTKNVPFLAISVMMHHGSKSV